MAAGIPGCITGIGIRVMTMVRVIAMTGGTTTVITGKRSAGNTRFQGMITAARIGMTTGSPADRHITGNTGTVNPAAQSGIVDVCTASHHQSA
jgi:hypothetical protein